MSIWTLGLITCAVALMFAIHVLVDAYEDIRFEDQQKAEREKLREH
ncbi:MAG: hypothetical protein R8M38_01665 [Mariprofundaceae bacterium]